MIDHSLVCGTLVRINFLIAMNQSEVAMTKIAELRAQYQTMMRQGDEGHAQLRHEYARLVDALVFQVLLPSESVATVREVIGADVVLDEVAKQVFSLLYGMNEVVICAMRSELERSARMSDNYRVVYRVVFHLSPTRRCSSA